MKDEPQDAVATSRIDLLDHRKRAQHQPATLAACAGDELAHPAAGVDHAGRGHFRKPGVGVLVTVQHELCVMRVEQIPERAGLAVGAILLAGEPRPVPVGQGALGVAVVKVILQPRRLRRVDVTRHEPHSLFSEIKCQVPRFQL